MKNILKLEELGLLILSIFAFYHTDFPWWYYLAFILLPDIGMLGYAINNKIGALTYNFFHHRLLSVVFYLSGFQLKNEWLVFGGIILLGHISLDRLLGYGLKYPDSFKNTHLGKLNG
jgi:hypothetical protein